MLIEEYKIYLEKSDLLPSTINAYCYDVNHFLNYLKFLGIEVVSVTPKTISKYVKSLSGGSRRTRRRLASLSSYFGFLLGEEIVNFNPVSGVKRPRTRYSEPKFLKIYEVDKTRESCPNLLVRTIVDTFYLTGIRLEELRKSQLGSLDLEIRQLKVVGKGKKDRYVMFPKSLANLFGEYLHLRDTFPIFPDSQSYLFITPQGKVFSRNQLEYMMRKLSKITGIKVRPHILRHSFATHAIEKGMRRQSVQEILGHESVSTTDWYIHLEPDTRSDYDRAFP